MRNYETRRMEDKAGVNENESVVKLFVYRCIKIIVALVYLSMVFVINAVYVQLTVGAGDLMLVLLEVGIFIINSIFREFGIYYLVHYIFDKSNVLSSQNNKSQHNFTSHDNTPLEFNFDNNSLTLTSNIIG